MDKTLYISPNIKTIKKYQFNGNSDIETAIIPNSVEILEENCFKNCKKLQTVYLYANIESIPDSAFEACFNLKKIIIKSPNILRIGNNSFSNTSIKNISIPSSIKYIGDECFKNCHELLEIDIPNTVLETGSSVFQNCIKLEKIQLSDNIQTISKNFCTNCLSLKEIFIPKSVLKINFQAFYKCLNLENIFFDQNSCIDIEDQAFRRCLKIVEINFPFLKKFGNGVFLECPNIKSIKSKNKTMKDQIEYNILCNKISQKKINCISQSINQYVNVNGNLINIIS